MKGIDAIRLAAGDLWEDSWLLIGMGIIGGLLSLLVVPLPFVLAAHYGMTYKITEDMAVSLRLWVQQGREHASFFYKWFALFVVVSVLILSNFTFYSRYDTDWARLVSGAMIGLWLLWLLPQPLVPAVYFWQADQRLRVALRNAMVLILTDPLSLIVIWGSVILIGVGVGYFSEVLLLLLQPWLALVSTRLVWLRLKHTLPAILE